MPKTRPLIPRMLALMSLAAAAAIPASAQLSLPPGADQWPAQCEAGDADACMNQGIRFQHGIETDVSWGGAAQYWTKACKLGATDGCLLAYEVYSGKAEGFPADIPRLVASSAIGCEQGIVLQCADAGLRLMMGDGVPKNVALALPLYAQACELDDPLACAILSTEYLDGEQGTTVDPEKAVMYGKKGCALEQQDACRVVEAAYMLPEYSTFEPQAGLEYANGNCEDGSKESCANLGNVYVEIGEYELGTETYEKACGMGMEEACTVAANFRTWLKQKAEYEAWEARQAERKAALDGLIAAGSRDEAMRAALFDYGSKDLAEYVAKSGGGMSGFSTNNLYVLSLWFPGGAIGGEADKELASRGTGLEGRFGEGTNTAGAADARYRAAYGSSPPSYSSSGASSLSSPPRMKSAAEISAATRDRYRWAHCTMAGSNTSAKVCQ